MAAAVLLCAAWLALGSAWFARPELRGMVDPTPTGYRVRLNEDDAGRLQLLPGIGPRLAERIAEHRDQRGPFESLEDVEAVHGIGPRLRDRMEPWVVVK